MQKFFTRRAVAVALALAATAVTAVAQENNEVPKARPVAEAKPQTESRPADAKYSQPRPARVHSQVRPLSVNVDLLSGTKIAGTLTDATSLDMQTSFGSANIPLSEVAGIRFASADDATTTVVMLNGDSITGATDVKLVTIETEWGVATINGQSVQSIMFVPSVVWNPLSGLNGKRWTLVNEKQAVAGKPVGQPGQPGQPTQPGQATTPVRTTSGQPYPNSQPFYGN
jgi:hypothetical protein